MQLVYLILLPVGCCILTVLVLLLHTDLDEEEESEEEEEEEEPVDCVFHGAPASYPVMSLRHRYDLPIAARCQSVLFLGTPTDDAGSLIRSLLGADAYICRKWVYWDCF